MQKEEHLEELESDIDSIKWGIIGLSETCQSKEKAATLKSGRILYQTNDDINYHVEVLGFLVNQKCIYIYMYQYN